VNELLWVLAGLAALLALTGWLSQRLRLPSALGYLLVGVALPQSVTDARLQEIVHLDEVKHIAVLMLLFFIGLELDLRTLRKVLHDTRVVSVFNIVVPLLLVGLLARAFGWSLREALVLGIALSLSSTIFGERLSATPGFPGVARSRMLGVLLAEDVAAGALLAILALMAGGSQGGGLLEPLTAIGVLLVTLAVLAAIALLVVPRLIDEVARLHSPELVILASGALLLLLSAAGDWAGSAELGAFLAGMAAAEAGSRFTIRNALSGLRSISLAVFFFASGLVVDPLLALQQWPLVLASIAVVVVSKVAVHGPSSMAVGLNAADGLRVGFAMSTVGEFSLILVAAAVVGGIAHPALPAVVTGAIVGLLLVAPLLMKAAAPLSRALARTPRPLAAPVQALVQGMRRRRQAPAKAPRRSRGHARTAAAFILQGVIFAAAVALNAWLPSRFPAVHPVVLTIVVFAGALAVAAPFLYQLFRAYRAFVHAALAVTEPPRFADRLKVRLADAVAATVLVLAVLAVAAALGASWPVLLASLFVAVGAAAVAWRQLSELTATLESSLARVLGTETDLPPTLLDDALHRYGWDFRVMAFTLPYNSSLVGQTLGASRLRTATGATIAVIKRGAREIVNPGVQESFRPGDVLVLVGDPSQLARAEALLESGEEPLRMAAESRAASVRDLEVQAGSWVLADPARQDRLEDESGTLVVGHWPKGAEHPAPWLRSVPLEPGDRLVAMGTPLQLERLNSLLSEPTGDGGDAESAPAPSPRDGPGSRPQPRRLP
jgi:CPA2 family monovalent cation:H+ antiporter-2